MIDVMAIKLKVIKAACGICALSEPELLQRLEALYIEGIAEGVKVAREQLRQASLTWAMACPHECPACDAMYEAVKGVHAVRVSEP